MVDNRCYYELVLCAGNSARSIMVEGLINVLGKGRLRAYSAGSCPTGRVNPFAIEQLNEFGYVADDLRSKSWDEFTVSGAPPMDLVITVCSNAGGEVCPVWPGAPAMAHWDFEDPAAVEGSDDDKRAAFAEICTQIRRRVTRFVALPLQTMSRDQIQHAMDAIGQE